MNRSGARRLDTGGRLALDWTRLRTRPSALAIAREWHLVDGRLDDLDQILLAVGFERPHDAECERRLRRLTEIAATDDLAARVVVQRIRPGLLAVARRRRGMADHVFEELLASAWIAIRTFNPSRAPSSIAASLISDADYTAFRAAGRRRSSGEMPTENSFDELPATDEPSACEELAGILADAVDAGIEESDLELVRMLLAAPTAEHVADVLEITPRTIRNRRKRITTKLRAIALAA